MLNNSRIDIYDYLYDLFYDVVTKNIYKMNEPQELTESDVKDGFIVLRVGDMYDESEFIGEAYGTVRCYVQAYIPPKSRGRLDSTKYKSFEKSINSVIGKAIAANDNMYGILEDSILSLDAMEESNANNIFYMFIKSFVVMINE